MGAAGDCVPCLWKTLCLGTDDNLAGEVVTPEYPCAPILSGKREAEIMKFIIKLFKIYEILYYPASRLSTSHLDLSLAPWA